MRDELNRNQVIDAQTTCDNLRDAAYHEAGHVVVARFLGLTIGKIEIEEDGSGRADISSAEHLPLIDQIALCVAGIEAQELFNCPMHEHAALGDHVKVSRLVAGLTDAERSTPKRGRPGSAGETRNRQAHEPKKSNLCRRTHR